MDKYVHLSLVDPEPDGIERDFAVPDTNLVSGTVRVYIDGQLITVPEYDPLASPAQTQYIKLDLGRLVIEAPDEGMKIRVSYNFRWFTDTDLLSFLTEASQLLGFEAVTDSGITVQVRTPLISFAAHYAYLKMAAQSAQALTTAAAGFEGDNSKEHPYWMDMAKMAWDEAEKALELVNTNPSSSIKPAMRFVAYRLPRYVPRS